jgi:cell division protein FtsB
MAKIKELVGKIQLVKVRSGKLTMVMIAVAIALSMGALIVLQIAGNDLRNRTEDLYGQAAQLEAENQEIAEDMAQVDSIHGIVEIAEEELGLVQPDAVFYQTEP